MIRALFVLCAIGMSLLAASGCSLFYSKPEAVIVRPPYEPIVGALGRDYFQSKAGDLVGRYPRNWLQVNTENIAELENIEFIYTDENRQSAFVLTEIPGTAELRRKVERDGLTAVADESLRLRTKKNSEIKITKQPESYVTDGKHYTSYEYETGKQMTIMHHRVICVTTGIRYYELAIVELHPAADNSRREVNFRLLQTVISALEGTTAFK